MTWTPRLAETDPYTLMSKRAIFERLSAWKGMCEGVTRSQWLAYCGSRLPATVSEISDTLQQRFSRAFWQLDRGYLKATKRNGKLYLTIGGQRRQDQPHEAPKLAGWSVDWDQSRLTWRP